MVGRVLLKPIGYRIIVLKERGVVARKVVLLGRLAPKEFSALRLFHAANDVKKRADGIVLDSNKGDFVGAVDHQRKILQKLVAVFCIVERLDFQNVVSDFAVGAEIHVGKFSACDRKLFKLQFFQDALSA